MIMILFLLTIIGIVGEIGAGKSFTMLKEGLEYAEVRQKQIVANFNINIEELTKLCLMPRELDSFLGWVIFNIKNCIHAIKYNFYLAGWMKKPIRKIKPRYPWILKLCREGGIIQMPSVTELQALFIPQAVVLLDEAGLFVNSRCFMNTSMNFLAELVQSRKTGVDFIYCAQFDQQVDKQLRLVTQYYILCQSLTAPNRKERRPELYWKQVFWMGAKAYMYWETTFKNQDYWKTKFAFSIRTDEGTLTEADRQIFKCFNSLDRLDMDMGGTKRPTIINTIFKSNLPKDYYKLRLQEGYFDIIKEELIEFYHAENDPLSDKYQELYGYYFKAERNFIKPKSEFRFF